MKSVNFQRNKSLIRIKNEDKIRKRRNWDRIIYLFLLAAFGCFMIWYLSSKTMFVHANGQVIIESTHIRLTQDSRIINVRVAEGDSICMGDTLFSFAHPIKEDDGSGSGYFSGTGIGNYNEEQKDNWWLKELYALKKKVALNLIDIRENEFLIATYKSEVARLTNEVVLDALPKTRLDYVQNEIIRLGSINEKLKSENAQLSALMGTLGPMNKGSKNLSFKNLGTGGGFGAGGSEWARLQELTGEFLTEERFFRAPMDGVVTRIFIKSMETALRTEDIMTLHKDHPAYIKTYFEQEDVNSFQVGDEFTVIFPDGSESVGVLRRFYISTYQVPEEFQKKYESTTRAIAADIYPVNEEEMNKWKNFYKMSVEIRRFKY